MSIGYDIGFTKKPEQSEIDSFMKSLGFEIETSKKRTGNYTRVYILNNKSVPREIELFYKEEAKNQREFFRERAGEIQSYGCLKTYSTEEAHPDLEDKLRIIEEKKVATQHDYYKYLATERLKFYETALALRDHYHAFVRSEQTGEEINPNEPFPETKL